MARNLGESFGVGATLELRDDNGLPLPEADRFGNLTLLKNLKTIEETITDLTAPKWPADVLGKQGEVDPKKAATGAILFKEHCAHCHEPCLLPASEIAVLRPLLLDPKYTPRPNDPSYKVPRYLWHIKTVPVEDIGTDPQAAMNFVNRRINLEKTGLTTEQVITKVRAILGEEQRRKIDWAKQHHEKDPGSGEAEIQKQLDKISITNASIGAALNYLDIFIQKKYYDQLGISSGHVHPEDDKEVPMEYDGEGALDTPQVLMAYKPRPLGGVWATAPYLHNGSVPTLYDLLSPANERPRKFYIRNRMDFDPVRVGLAPAPAGDKGFLFDTTIPGNRNGGHEFRAGYSEWKKGSPPSHGVIGPELTPDERWQIIEYLKIYQEEPKECSADDLESAQGN
jgi:hypothetical protein